MSGSCYGCGSSFSFLRKERGCKNCGFSFCKSCLPKKHSVPKRNNEKHEVCVRCYSILAGKPQPDTGSWSPPENFKKRVAALADGKTGPAAPQYKLPNEDKETLCAGLSGKDLEIAERLLNLKEKKPAAPSQADMESRLQALKADRPAPPSERELRERVAILKGKDPNQAEAKHVFPTEKRSEQEQIDDLIARARDELHLEGEHTADASEDTAEEQAEEDSVEDVRELIRQAAAAVDGDADKAVKGLKDDKELWSKIQDLKRRRDKKGASEVKTKEWRRRTRMRWRAASLNAASRRRSWRKLLQLQTWACQDRPLQVRRTTSYPSAVYALRMPACVAMAAREIFTAVDASRSRTADMKWMITSTPVTDLQKQRTATDAR